MSTSLRSQLLRLKAPQATAVTTRRSTASILFDNREAASKDRRTIYELGLRGLEEMIAINPMFDQFKHTLFDTATMHLERSVEQMDVNALLDVNIERFLQHLSPYFLLRPAQMCLEWLIRRFHIHDFNQSAMMALALPYHESTAFVRVLQVIRMRHKEPLWNWLRPLQKLALPIPKSQLIVRAQTDLPFLEFVCHATTSAVRALDKNAYLLQSLFNFYTTVVVGVISSGGKSVEEKIIRAVLPSILIGLNSNVADFASGSYVVAAQLVAQAQFSLKLCKALVDRIIYGNCAAPKSAAVLLLICITDTQSGSAEYLSPEDCAALVQQSALLDTLAHLAGQNISICSLCLCLMRQGIGAIQKNTANATALKRFLDELLTKIRFTPHTAQMLLSTFLDSFTSVPKPASTRASTNDMDIIDLGDSDEDTGSYDFQNWYSSYLGRFERLYPREFDAVIKTDLSGSPMNSNRAKAIRIGLGFRLKYFGENAIDFYVNLNHHSAAVRQNAVETLVSQYYTYRTHPENFKLMQEWLGERLRADTSEHVIAEILRMPTTALVEVLGSTQACIDGLIEILYKAQRQANNWGSVQSLVVEHLTTESLNRDCDVHVLQFALLPLLLPSESSVNTRNNIVHILQSTLRERVKLLQHLKVDDAFKASTFKKQFLDVLANSGNELPDIQGFVNHIETRAPAIFSSAQQFSHFLLLLTACGKRNLQPDTCMDIIGKVLAWSKLFKVIQIRKEKKQPLKDDSNYVALQLFADFLNSLVGNTLFGQLIKWECTAAGDLECFVAIFNMLCEGAFNTPADREAKEWLKLITNLFGLVFKTKQNTVDFLCNFYAYSNLPFEEDNYPLLQITAMRLMEAQLRNREHTVSLDLKHLMKICTSLCHRTCAVRQQAVQTLRLAADHLDGPLKLFTNRVQERHEEITLDEEQFPLVLYTILKTTPKAVDGQQQQLKEVLGQVLELLNEPDFQSQPTVVAVLLKMLKHINDESTLRKLLPLASRVLTSVDDHTDDAGAVPVLRQPKSLIFQMIIERFDCKITPKLLSRSDGWQIIEEIFARQHILWSASGSKACPLPCVLLDSWNEELFECMPSTYQAQLMKLIVIWVSAAENDVVFASANKFLKKCPIDCKPLAEILDRMSRWQQQPPGGAKRKRVEDKSSGTASPCDRDSTAWKEGIALLELLENKRRLSNAHLLLPSLFHVLKTIVEMDEQVEVEYAKQLTLSSLLWCMQMGESHNLTALLPKAVFHINQIVQCLRSTNNPLTQHNSLMLLCQCARLYPQEVLYKVVDIFTFVGSAIVRQDDAYSFHIINTIIESIVPILIESQQSKTPAPDGVDQNGEEPSVIVIGLLKVFSDIILDVPEHRRLALYTKLLQTLDAPRYFWTFACIVFDAHIVAEEKQKSALVQKKQIDYNETGNRGRRSDGGTQLTGERFPKRLSVLLELSNCFPPATILQTCIELLHHIKVLTVANGAQTGNKHKQSQNRSGATEAGETALFDLSSRTPKQLRHYQYMIMQFTSAVSSSTNLVRKVALLDDAEVADLKSFYQNFIIKTLCFIPVVNEATETVQEQSTIKFWKIILHHLHDVLDNAVSLLSPEMFLTVVHGLLHHQILSIRKKSIELLITKLQRKTAYFEKCDDTKIQKLIQSLAGIVEGILTAKPAEGQTAAGGTTATVATTSELVFVQQNALIAIKLLAKVYTMQHIDAFKQLSSTLTIAIKRRAQLPAVLLATVILTLVEITATLRAHILSQVPNYMPHLVEVLQEQAANLQQQQQQPPDTVCIAIVAGFQKVTETMPLFLGPYIVDIVSILSCMQTIIVTSGSERHQRSSNLLQRITAIWSILASGVHLRILVPCCTRSYVQLSKAGKHREFSSLMQLVGEMVGHASAADLSAVQKELSDFYIHALEFRQTVSGLSLKEVSYIEMHIIDAFVIWVLKLSETSFRPIYQRIHDWAFSVENGGQQEACILTFFVLSRRIAESLKSLFVIFAGDIVEDAVKLLISAQAESNADNTTNNFAEEVLCANLETLQMVFLYDNKKFINEQRFGALLQPLVNQLERSLVLGSEQLQNVLVACIAQFAAAISNDVLWKQLNYQVLMKTRTSVPELRILAFRTCVEIARKLGEDFTALLPETLPFIAELLEDDNARVEKNVRRLVQELELIIGDSLQKYI